jgi:hypothetical protein
MCAAWSIGPLRASAPDAAVNAPAPKAARPLTQQTAESYAATFDANVLARF